ARERVKADRDSQRLPRVSGPVTWRQSANQGTIEDRRQDREAEEEIPPDDRLDSGVRPAQSAGLSGDLPEQHALALVTPPAEEHPGGSAVEAVVVEEEYRAEQGDRRDAEDREALG